eukprot:3939865-Rhodomonas_salina.1
MGSVSAVSAGGRTLLHVRCDLACRTAQTGFAWMGSASAIQGTRGLTARPSRALMSALATAIAIFHSAGAGATHGTLGKIAPLPCARQIVPDTASVRMGCACATIDMLVTIARSRSVLTTALGEESVCRTAPVRARQGTMVQAVKSWGTARWPTALGMERARTALAFAMLGGLDQGVKKR